MTDPKGAEEGELAWLGVLAEPVRLRLYRYVASRGVPVGRAEAAEAAGVQRTLAAFHLDRLAEAGLLDVVYRRTSGRTGPGAGRPAKLYLRSPEEHALSLPPRAYDTAAEVFAEAIEAAGAEPETHAAARAHGEREGRAARARLTSAPPGPQPSTPRDEPSGPAAPPSTRGEASSPPAQPAAPGDENGTVRSVAGPSDHREAGDDAGAGVLWEALADRGYEPYRDDDGAIRLRNCPFHRLAADFPPLTCGMNYELLTGFAAGVGAAGVVVRMDPRPGECCVAIVAASGEESKNNEH